MSRLILALMALLHFSSFASAQSKPHMVIFLSDDHTWRDSSVYGSPDIKTPNMARLASAGMTFENAFVASPSCAPSRAALLTGLYPANNGAEPNHSRPRADIKKLPAYLQELGYQVVSFGKVGHYHQTSEYGFDIARHYGYHEDIAIPKALKWLKNRKSRKPLCLFVGTNWPHVPWPKNIGEIDPAQLKVPPNHVDNLTTRQWRARYMAAIKKMDTELGQVYDLAREKLGEKTLFIHTSDHGAQWPFGKWNLYDDGIRTPLIVSWPGHVKSNVRTDAMVSWIDILPTIIDAAGGEKPASIDGRSFLPVVLGKTDKHRGEIFTTHSGDGKNNVYPIRAVQTADGWKYIHNLHPEFLFTNHVTKAHQDSGYWSSWLQSAETSSDAKRKVLHYQQRPAEELYRITEDPYEQQNLIKDPAHTARIAKLRQKLNDWMKQTKDQKTVFGPPKLISAIGKPNVLLILVDDLKPALGCYGDTVAITPNIDALARRGMRFDLAYCNQAVCAPSRFTLMLGSHSTSTGLYGLGSQLRDLVPDAVTMPQYFEKYGYRTESLGKVFHIGHGNLGDPQSFSVPHFADKVIEYLDPASTDGGKLTREEALFTNQQLDRIRQLPRGAAFESPVAKDTDYADGRVAVETVKRLRAAKERLDENGTPFFITVGFVRPHLPFSAPQKYWELYDPKKLPMPQFEQLPAGAPSVAGKRGGEITAYKPVPVKGTIDENLKRKLIHGYYASTSFVDAQIGKVMTEYDRLGLSENTIVVLWGDHGFHLGDLGIWTKHTNYEQANRIPILIHAPGVTKPSSSTRQLTESVDLFPTLAELTDLPSPQGPQPIDGKSLVAVLKNPAARVRDHAFHAYPKKKLGRAIRTERYRLVEWKKIGAEEDQAEYELYDYETDPLETKNLATKKPEIVAKLKKKLAVYPVPVPRNLKKKKRKHQPNVVVVFIDDMGWSDLSCYQGKRTQTENIDRLAAQGIRFTNFYVNSPICSPSRVALTTGQYPQRWRISSYLARRKLNRKRGIAQWLDTRAPVLARELQKAGYATGHFGKWHMGGQRDVGEAPLITEYGFDRSLTNFEGLGPRVLPLKNAYDGKKIRRHDLGSANLGRGPIRWEDRSVITATFVKEAISFIDESQRLEKPFYINLWPDDVHSPFFPPEDLRKKTDQSKRALYYAVLDAMDQQLGKLFDRIGHDEKLRNNTLILLMSDNGHEEGAGSSYPLRGAKTWLYEGGVRSPLIVWGPGLLAGNTAGTTNITSILCALDINRSIYTLTQTELPKQSKPDGEDFASTLLGKEQQNRIAPIFWRRPPDRPGTKENDNPDLAARHGKWKYYVNYDGSNRQLYDLEKDISETKNLQSEHKKVSNRLHKALMQWNQSLPPDAGDPRFGS